MKYRRYFLLALLSLIGFLHPRPVLAAGQAVSFDGLDDIITVEDEPHFDFTVNDSITIEAWIYPTNIITAHNNRDQIVTKGIDGGNRDFEFAIYGAAAGRGYLWFGFTSIGYPGSGPFNQYWTDQALIRNNNWYHVAVTYTFGNASSTRLYVNGVLAAGGWKRGSGDNIPEGNELPLQIGAETDSEVNERFDGIIDEVKVYRHILSAEEINSNYNGGNGVYGLPDPSLIGGWHLDEGTGTIAYDYSGCNSTGILVNGPVWVNGRIVPQEDPIFGAISNCDVSELKTTWSNVCVQEKMEITGSGMLNSNPQTINLTDPGEVNWLLVQVNGQLNGMQTLPKSTTLSTGAPQSIILNIPTQYNSYSYKYESSFTPASVITGEVEERTLTWDTPRALVLYAMRDNLYKWTSIGTTTNGLVDPNTAGSETFSETISFPNLVWESDLEVTAVVVGNTTGDGKSVRVEATAGGVSDFLEEPSATNGEELNIFTFVLPAVPVGTNQVTVTLETDSLTGERVFLNGVNVSYLCSALPTGTPAPTPTPTPPGFHPYCTL